MTKEEELKQKVIDFVKGIAQEFPNAGKRMENSIQLIEDDVRESFSGRLLLHLGSYLGKTMSEESPENLTQKELEVLIKAAGEYIVISEEAGNRETSTRAQNLKKILGLELRSVRLVDTASSSAKEVMGMMMEAMASGADCDLADDEKMRKLREVEARAIELSKEKDLILTEVVPEEVRYDAKRTELAKEIISSMIRRLNRAPANHQDMLEKKCAEDILAKIKLVLKIDKKEQEWEALKGECGEVFGGSGEDLNDVLDMRAGGPVIVGLVMMPKE
ncbi:MAG: hypothetical protein WC788_05715 [Candidatus Paceibacterota bacterium]|jgi:hypothetical protein